MMNDINIGDFDTLVTLMSQIISQGTKGEKVVSYAVHSQVLAKIERSDSDAVVDENFESGIQLTMTTYKLSAISTKWRVAVDGKTYDISSVDIGDRMTQYMQLKLTSIE
jgi:SPP1 family predicted phage head-tail adaptor